MPLVVVTALAAPLAGWFGMGPAMIYSQSTLPGQQADATPAAADAQKPAQTAILAASRGEFEAGLGAIAAKNVAAAVMARDNLMPRDSLERKALTFAIVTSGFSGLSSAEYANAAQVLADWPDTGDLQRHFERALYLERPNNDEIFAAFRTEAPVTPEGNILLARAFKAIGEKDKSKAIVEKLWSNEPLNMWLEGEILKEFSGDLTAADHKARMDYLLYRDRIKQAARFAPLGQAQPLFDAWSAVIRQANNAPALLKAAASSPFKDDDALLFANIVRLEQAEDYAGAAKLLAKGPKSVEAQANSDAWWHEQRIVARGLFEQGSAKAAYDVVAKPLAQSPEALSDAEFHAGWIALTGLNDGQTASGHFLKLLASSNRPASRARAFYWLGRADLASGGNGQSYFIRAARHDHTFFGLVAASMLKAPQVFDADALDRPTPSDRMHFNNLEAVRAIGLFEKNGYAPAAKLLYRGLADELETPEDLEILAEKAAREQDSATALDIGKKTYANGAGDARLAYPLGAIPDDAQLSGRQLALAYAIARQESGFNPQAVSPAKARGLMQILPETAKDMASQLGLAYAPEKLTTDTAYNAILGTQYLDNQIKRHNGSYVLTFAAYNAGPGKVKEWLDRFGDPRGKSLEFVINWIESIPYPETRDYVEHVMENFEAYQKQLGLPANMAADLAAGS